jgi:hypothetical protein
MGIEHCKVRKQIGVVPFVPFYGRVIPEATECLWKRTTGECYGESSLLLDRFLLSLYDKGFESLCECGLGGKGIENGWIWGVVHT